MADVRFFAQGVEYNYVAAFYFFFFRFRNKISIGYIREIIHPETHHPQFVMHHPDRGDIDIFTVEGFYGNSVELHARNARVIYAGKTVTELVLQLVNYASYGINGHIL